MFFVYGDIGFVSVLFRVRRIRLGGYRMKDLGGI